MTLTSPLGTENGIQLYSPSEGFYVNLTAPVTIASPTVIFTELGGDTDCTLGVILSAPQTISSAGGFAFFSPVNVT